MHRLSVYILPGRSFKTTNGLQSTNALVCQGRPPEELEPAAALVGHSAPRHRAAFAGGDGLPSPPKLHEALKRELTIEQKRPDTSKDKKEGQYGWVRCDAEEAGNPR